MPNFFEQAKKALDMRNKMKKLQKELEETVLDYENGGVKVSARGDVSIVAVSISDDSLLDPAKKEKLTRLLADNANKALKLVKDVAEQRGKEAMKELGLGGALGM